MAAGFLFVFEPYHLGRHQTDFSLRQYQIQSSQLIQVLSPIFDESRIKRWHHCSVWHHFKVHTILIFFSIVQTVQQQRGEHNLLCDNETKFSLLV